MKIKLVSSLLALLVISTNLLAAKPEPQGLRSQFEQLAALVEGLQRELAVTQSQLAATRRQLASVMANSVLGLDGALSMRQDGNGLDTIVFSGVNVQIINAVGATDSVNGVGNLVIGYNADSGAFVDRLGSHNIVLGDGQSYAGTGAVVTGKISSNRDLAVIVADNMSTTVGSNQQTVVGASRQVSVGMNLDTSVGSSQTTTIGANETITVGANSTKQVGGELALSVGQGANLDVGQDMNLGVGKNATIFAGDSLLANTGKASAEFKKDGTIRISGKDISISGSGEINVKAAGDLVLKGARILEN